MISGEPPLDHKCQNVCGPTLASRLNSSSRLTIAENLVLSSGPGPHTTSIPSPTLLCEPMTHPAARRPFHPSPAVRRRAVISATAMEMLDERVGRGVGAGIEGSAGGGTISFVTRTNSRTQEVEANSLGEWRRRCPGAPWRWA